MSWQQSNPPTQQSYQLDTPLPQELRGQSTGHSGGAYPQELKGESTGHTGGIYPQPGSNTNSVSIEPSTPSQQHTVGALYG